VARGLDAVLSTRSFLSLPSPNLATGHAGLGAPRRAGYAGRQVELTQHLFVHVYRW